MNKYIIGFISITLLILIVFSSFAYAINENTIAPLKNDLGAPVTSVGGLVELLIVLVRWFYTIVLILSVLFILMAAYDFITIQDKTDKIKKAKDKFIWSIVGIVVALLSYAVILLIKNFLLNSGG